MPAALPPPAAIAEIDQATRRDIASALFTQLDLGLRWRRAFGGFP